jgi:hypothetical protein
MDSIFLILLSSTMDPSQTHLCICIFFHVPCNTPRKLIDLLSRIKFNGKRDIIPSENILQLCFSCFSQKIVHEGVIGMIFTLTFEARVKSWCETFPTGSIHTLGQIIRIFLHAFENYNYDTLCEVMINIRKGNNEQYQLMLCWQFYLAFNFSL